MVSLRLVSSNVRKLMRNDKGAPLCIRDGRPPLHRDRVCVVREAASGIWDLSIRRLRPMDFSYAIRNAIKWSVGIYDRDSGRFSVRSIPQAGRRRWNPTGRLSMTFADLADGEPHAFYYISTSATNR